jgi:hypothetical protein
MAVAVGEAPQADAARRGAERLPIGGPDLLAGEAGLTMVEEGAELRPGDERQALIGGEGVQHVAEPVGPPRAIVTDRAQDDALRQAGDADLHLRVRAIGGIEVAEDLGEAAQDVVARVQQVIAEPGADFLEREGRRPLQHLLEAPLVGRRGDLRHVEAVVDVSPRRLEQRRLHRPRRGTGAVASNGPP